MNSYEKYFSVYEATDPPPIQTPGYQQIKSQYYSIFPSYDQEQNIGQQTADLARQFVGTKYQWGGISPSTGFDDEGFIRYVYKQNGIDLSDQNLNEAGQPVSSMEDARVGDIVFTNEDNRQHARIITKIQDGKVYTADSRNRKHKVVEEPLNTKPTNIRRVVPSKSYIVNYFIKKGLTEVQARGIYGNIMQESGGNIRATSSDGHNSYGIAQWTGDRKRRLFSMYGTNPSLEQQLDYLWWELNNTESEALAALRNTSTIYDATKVFMNKFERPHKDYANFNRRLKYANSII